MRRKKNGADQLRGNWAVGLHLSYTKDSFSNDTAHFIAKEVWL